MEIWKKIDGFEGYQASNLGNIKSLNYNGTKKEKQLKIILTFYKYYQIGIYNSNKKRKMFQVHRIVASTFIPNPENKLEVNHINGIKSDNRIENLEWNTRKENIQHSIKTGLTNQKGVNSKRSKLKADDIIYIRNSNLKSIELAKIYNISKSTISLVKTYKTYK